MGYFESYHYFWSNITFFSGQQKQADSVIVSAEMDNLSYQYFLEGFLTGNGTIK